MIGLGIPWGTGENVGCTGEHLGALARGLGAPATSLGMPARSLCALATSLGAPASSLGAPRITVEQSGKNYIFFGNAAGAPGHHSYYISFNDC